MTRDQDIRAEIILQAYGLRPLSITASTLARQSRKQGMDYSESDMARESRFLVGQGMLAESTDPVTGATRYAITSAGVIHYERDRS